MAKIGCPSCGAAAKSAAGKPYCASCGWNVAEAKRVVRKRGIVYAILIAVLAGIFTWGFISAQQTTMAGYVVGFIVLCMLPIIFLIWVWPWMRLRRVEQRLGMAGGAGSVGAVTMGGGESAKGGRTTMMISGREVVVDMPPQAMSGESAAAGSATGSGSGVAVNEGRAVFSVGSVKSKAGADVERYKEWNAAQDADGKGFAQKGEAEAELKRVVGLPVPRPVKYRVGASFRKLAWSLLAFAYFVARPLGWAFRHGWSMQTLRSVLGLVGVELAIFGWYWVKYVRGYWEDKRLLAQGAVTLGRVTAQTASGRERSSEITYVFEDGRGNAVTGKGSDVTRRYFEKMWVVVFYDAEAPAKNVSQAGAMYELK